MQFGDYPLEEAVGAILAHSHRLPECVLKKGRHISKDDIAALRAAGRTHVVCARLESDDILEDDAADHLAASVAGNNVLKAAAFTGRCNLFADIDGLVIYDTGRLDGFNLVDESITLGVVPPYQHVAKGQMVATLKIIPFALPERLVTIARSIAERSAPLIRIAAFKPLRAGLVQSRLTGTKPSVLDSTFRVTGDRLKQLGATLAHEVRCDHTEADVARSINELLRQDVDLVLISGASAVVDRRDVVPASVEKAGGRIEHFGMPVDPGNLMLMGQIGPVPVIGMPGCARSPKLNGFDWVLQRIAAGVPAGPGEVMRMGTGGLLKDVLTRPLPRARARRGSSSESETNTPSKVTSAPRIAVLLLAAGQSRRMGSINKLLAEIDGVPMIRHVATNLAGSQATAVVAVTGHQADAARDALQGLDIAYVHNPAFADGLSTSLAAGIDGLPPDIDGVVVCLGDMPRVTSAVIDKLIAAFDPLEGRAICVPTWRGKRGNPVLWDRRFFEEMTEVSGDVGARHLIGRHQELVVEVEMAHDGIMVDIDTPAALAAITDRLPA